MAPTTHPRIGSKSIGRVTITRIDVEERRCQQPKTIDLRFRKEFHEASPAARDLSMLLYILGFDRSASLLDARFASQSRDHQIRTWTDAKVASDRSIDPADVWPPLINQLDTRTTAFITLLGTSAFAALVPWVGAAPFVFCALLAEGLLAGRLEINLNVEGDRVDARLGKAINRAHSFWGLGFLITALISAAVRQASISIEPHFLAVFALALILGIPPIGGIKMLPPGLSKKARTRR